MRFTNNNIFLGRKDPLSLGKISESKITEKKLKMLEKNQKENQKGKIDDETYKRNVKDIKKMR
ncbi:MAG: hypothetical protein J6J42_05565 [Lachnospiraceae bacterium]|nr:hypothetical protein [Lachnospiraceae bacterium]MBP3609788.1 hypothetical protein [Lachnospiraceae bacterium]